MVNDIVAGVSLKLNEIFGDKVEIYTQALDQGMGEGCFFISSVTVIQQPLLGRRKIRACPINIAYVSDLGNADAYDVRDRLLDTLDMITLPDGTKMRGTNMTGEIVEGILQFFVNYDMVVLLPTQEVDKMGKVEKINLGAKG